MARRLSLAALLCTVLLLVGCTTSSVTPTAVPTSTPAGSTIVIGGATSTATPLATSTSVPASPTQATATPEACPICKIDMARYQGPLARREAEGLLLALNEAYRAEATYSQVVTDLGHVQPFAPLRLSKAAHVEFLLGLFRTYQVPIPNNPWTGKTTRFTTLREAVTAALKGEPELAEVYARAIETTGREDIIAVYEYLHRASLEAAGVFERRLGKLLE